MNAQTAVVLGSTGLIGQQVVKKLVADPGFIKVRLLVRKAVHYDDSKIEVLVTDFSNLDDYKDKLGTGDCIFCCVGTTMKQVKGDKVAYRKVDYDIAVNAAMLGKEAGFTKYLLVSAVGANISSGNFYLHLKGEVEASVVAASFKATHIFQPSLLVGERSTPRFGEQVGKVLMKVASLFLIGKAGKYKAIDSNTVAMAMVNAAKSQVRGVKVYRYDEMVKVAQAAGM